jgi:hypothetical protein
MKTPTKKRSTWLNTTPDIACSQLKVPNAAISDTVLRCQEGIGKKVPIFVLSASPCASVPKVEISNVATMIHATLRPYRASRTANTRIATREQIEIGTVKP